MKLPFRPALFCLLAALALPAGAGAQQPDTLPGPERPDSARYEVPELRVRAVRPSTASGGASTVELAVDSVSAPPSPSLDEVLRQMPLVRVRSNSRGQAQPSVRGMEERQIAVLLDGVPITLGWDNRTDLSVVPLLAAREVVLVRGLSSVLDGPNVLGGVVKVDVTRGSAPLEPPAPFRFRSRVEHTGALALAAEVGRLLRPGDDQLLVRAGAGLRTRSGLPRPGGVEQPPGTGSLLLNSDRDHANGFLAARWRGGGGTWASLSTMAFGARRGVVPELHLIGSDDPAPRFWRIPDHHRWISSLSAGTGWRATPLGRGDLEASVGLDLQHLEIDAFEGPFYRDSVSGETGDDRTVTLRLTGDHTLGAGMLRTALTWAGTRHEEVLPEGRAEYEQRLWSLGLETEQPLAPGSGAGWVTDPRLTIGASLDGSSTPKTGGFAEQPPITDWGVRAAFSVGLAEGAARVHGGVSRKVRFAALRELYSGALGKFEPNPDLGPEVLKVGEIGITARPGVQELQLTLFQQRLEGSIVRAVTPGGKFRRENRGETRSTGLEAVAALRLGAWDARADLTLQDVTLRGGERGERPEYQPGVVLGAALSGPFPGGFALRIGAELTGRQYGANPRTGDFEALDPSLFLEAGLSRSFPGGAAGLPPFRVGITVENVTDEAIFDQLGLPRPGRTLSLELDVY